MVSGSTILSRGTGSVKVRKVVGAEAELGPRHRREAPERDAAAGERERERDLEDDEGSAQAVPPALHRAP